MTMALSKTALHELDLANSSPVVSNVEETGEMSEYSVLLEDWDGNDGEQTAPGTTQP